MKKYSVKCFKCKQNERLKILAKARELSERITKRTIAAGITYEELEQAAYEALQEVQEERSKLNAAQERESALEIIHYLTPEKVREAQKYLESLLGEVLELDIPTIQQIAYPILKRHNVVKASIFGDYARGEQQLYSHVGILIEYWPGTCEMFSQPFFTLRSELSVALMRKVELMIVDNLAPHFRDEVQREKVDIFPVGSNG